MMKKAMTMTTRTESTKLTTRRSRPNCRIAAVAGISLLCAATSLIAQPTSELTTELVANGFSSPLLAISPADDERLFVVEQSGRVRIVVDDQVLSTPFLDVSGLITFSGERGLLGMAFHPDFANNGFLYINYSDLQSETVIARFQVDDTDPDVVDFSSHHILMTMDQPFSNHNGGMIAFRPTDELLYIGMGDGGSGNDPQNRAQNIDSFMGKMLRIDVNSDDFPGDPDRNYAIPAGNPFINKDGLDEIWSTGWRNPWRWSFDRENGDMWAGDVGQSSREEVDFESAGTAGGSNYGWRCMEGTLCTGMSGCTCNAIELTDPINEYTHSEGCSITGGYVYKGTSIPLLRGTYFYSDYCRATLWTLKYDGNTVSDFMDRTNELDPVGLNIRGVSSFGEDADGTIYIIDAFDGELFRVRTAMQLAVSVMTAGQNAQFQVTDAPPNTQVFFAYSLKGLGDVFVPQLGVRLAIKSPKLLGKKMSNGSGTVTLTKNIPANSAGVNVWLQAAVNGNSTNVEERQIQ